MVRRGFSIKVVYRPLLLVWLLCLISGCSWIFDKESKEETVEDMRYGVALYHFFQDAYFDALTELYVGEKLMDMQQHQDSGRLLQGGISLSYGMENVAEPIFIELLDKYREGNERDQAWFYLAKIQYKNQNTIDTFNTLNRVSENFSGENLEESLFMRANLYLLKGSLVEAEQVINQLSELSLWKPYYWYNLGSYMAKQGEWQAAIDAFDQVLIGEINNSEKNYLFDKSRIAAGYAAISAENYEVAIDRFKQVGKNSPFVTQALLGYGWAEANRDNYVAALSPWQYLNKLSKLDPAVQESFLAIPYVYEKMNAKAESLAFYEDSIDVLEGELTTINSAISRYKNEPIDILFSVDDTQTIDRFSTNVISLNLDQELYLGHLLAKEEFQKGLLIHNDINGLRKIMSGNIERILVIEQVNQDQQDAWEKLFSQNKHVILKDKFQKVVSQRDQSIRRFNDALTDENYSEFDSPERYKLWQRIISAERKVEILKRANIPIDEESTKLRTLKGVLVWVAEDEKTTRKVIFNNSIKELNYIIAEVESRFDRVLLAISEQRSAPFDNDISMMKARLNSGYETIDQLFMQSEDYLRQLAINELDNQKVNLKKYIADAKLSIARLYDEGSTKVVE